MWAKWYVKVALAAVVVVVLAGTLFAWKATTRHSLTEDQVIALAEGRYAGTSSWKDSLVTTANPSAFWSGKTWTVTVAGPYGLATYVVDDATGEITLPTPTPRPTSTPTPRPLQLGMAYIASGQGSRNGYFDLAQCKPGYAYARSGVGQGTRVTIVGRALQCNPPWYQVKLPDGRLLWFTGDNLRQ